MATCRDIVTRALRMTGVVPREDDPTAPELRDGLTVLQTLYDSWLTGGMFGRLTDVYEPGSYEAGEGERVFLDTGGTLTLPTEIDSDRKPRDLVAIEGFVSGGTRVAYIWDRTAWVQITDLAEADEAPLSNRGVNGLAACLAVAYADEFGPQVGPGVLMQCRSFKTALSYKFGSERDVVAGTWF
jgi:hypothetical protein